MKSVLLICLLMLVFKHVTGQQVSDSDKAESIEIYTKWMSQNNVAFKQLPRVKSPSELVYDCDQNLFVKRINGDTLTFWLKSSWYNMGKGSARKLEELNEAIKRPSFGLTEYLEKFDEFGGIVLVTLAPRSFTVKSDTLFQLESFFKISYDSIETLIVEAFTYEEKRELNGKIIKDNQYHEFKPIFAPRMFIEKRSFATEKKGEQIELDHMWNLNGKKYYQISFKSQREDDVIVFPTYLFDDQYTFIQYDGCHKELQLLTPDREIFPGK